jgi:predicted nucleic acid-binding Zn finger protein
MKDVFELISEKGKIDKDMEKMIIDRFGKRGEKALDLVKSGNVKKYRDFFVVVGNEEYIVEENYCTCRDFEFKGRGMCSHIIAVKIASATGKHDFFDVFYMDLNPDFLKRGKR